MVVIMKPNATHEDIDKVVSRIESAGLQAQKSTGEQGNSQDGLLITGEAQAQ